MKDGPNIARVAALIGDRARADVLTALMADRALTATELSDIAIRRSRRAGQFGYSRGGCVCSS